MLDGDVGAMRPMPAAPADMVADALSRNVRQRVIGRFDPRFTKFLKFRQIDVGQQLVPTRGNPWIVQLDQKPASTIALYSCLSASAMA